MATKRKALHFREREGDTWEARAERGFRYEINRCRYSSQQVGERGPPFYDVSRIELSMANNPPDTLHAAKLLAEADFTRRRERNDKS